MITFHNSMDKDAECDYNRSVSTGSSAGASALGSGPRGRRFKSSLPD